MSDLHKDIKKAIGKGRLEGLDKFNEETSDDTQGLAKWVVNMSAAFEKEGFSQVRAMKAAWLMMMFDVWKDD